MNTISGNTPERFKEALLMTNIGSMQIQVVQNA